MAADGNAEGVRYGSWLDISTVGLVKENSYKFPVKLSKRVSDCVKISMSRQHSLLSSNTVPTAVQSWSVSWALMVEVVQVKEPENLSQSSSWLYNSY